MPTSLEESAMRYFDEMNYEYEYQYQLPNSELRHNFDFYLPSFHLLIEMDGSYWHKDQQQRDGYFDKMARLAGYKVVRITDKELTEFGPSVFAGRIAGELAIKIEPKPKLTKDEIRDKMSSYFELVSPGNVHFTTNRLQEFCDFRKLSYGTIFRTTITGKPPKWGPAKGWICKKI